MADKKTSISYYYKIQECLHEHATITFIIYADESIKLPVNKLLNMIQKILAQHILLIALLMKIRIKIMDTAIPY